ncbi:hypothetical protein [Streptomyces sp. ALB3]|uniref:hypothetical protein n=1 Tax=Streptomyces sp. ALB3 TaxID=3374278 RepID=UPI0037B1550D
MSRVGDRLQDTARQAADVYEVVGKVFVILTDDPDEPIVTVRCGPGHARALVRGHAAN